jgi:hypothetical protein
MQVAAAFLVAGSLVCLSCPAWSHEDDDHEHEYRERGAHVHGVAELNLAIEGESILVELATPAMNILGFEHLPRNAEERETLERAAALLEDGERWLRLPEAAGCRLDGGRVESGLLRDPGSTGSEHADGHSEFHVRYRFHCENPERVDTVTVKLFDEFPGMESILMQAVTGAGQIGGTLLPGRNRIELIE